MAGKILCLLFILFQILVPLYHTSLQCSQGKENGIIVARGMQQEHIQWQLKQDQILHMQADDWQNFSKKKAAKARAQRLSPVGRMTWRRKGRKWWCHNNAQWQNDTQEKSIWNQMGQKYNSTSRHNTKLVSQKIFWLLLYKFVFYF